MKNRYIDRVYRNILGEFRPVAEIKERILNAVLVALAVLLVLPLLATFLRIAEEGFISGYIIWFAYVGTIMGMALFRNRLPFRFKVYTLLAAYHLMALVTLWFQGLFGSYLIFFLFALIFSIIFLDWVAGTVSIFVAVLTMAFAGRSVVSGRLGLTMDFNDLSVAPSYWLSRTISAIVTLFLIGLILEMTLRVLSRSERSYHEIFDATSEAIFILDAKSGAILNVNQGMVDTFGFSRAEALLLTAEHLSAGTPPYTEKEIGQMIRITREERSQQFEWLAKRKDGTLFWAEVFFKSTYIAEHERILVALRDISDRKESERAIKGYQEHLEELVTQRTRALEEVQSELLKKEKLATLGQLTGTVSHELRNPLGTIYNAVFIITEGVESSDMEMVSKGLNLVERNARRCNNIISEMFYFTRPPGIVVDKVFFDAWLKELLEEHQPNVEVELETDLGAGVELEVDSESLRRAVINVVDNAAQACLEEGREGKRILVKSTVVGDHLELRISDNGPGMTGGLLEKVFEPLFSTKNFGVGLGLPIVRNIMEAHSGSVTIDSKTGEGTTVTLLLPIAS